MRCPAQWMFRYIKNLKQPPSSAMVAGTSYHKGLEVNYGQKIESKKDLKESEVLDAVSTEFDSKIVEVEEPKKVKSSVKDETISISKHYHETIAGTIQPKEVEKKIEVTFGNVDYNLIGYVDLITDNGLVIENKTTARTPSSISVDHLIQGSIYAMSEGVNQVRYDYAVKLKTPKVVTLTEQITEEQKAFTLTLLGEVDRAIQNEVFYPNRSNFMCSRKGCGYYRECEKKYGGRVRD